MNIKSLRSYVACLVLLGMSLTICPPLSAQDADSKNELVELRKQLQAISARIDALERQNNASQPSPGSAVTPIVNPASPVLSEVAPPASAGKETKIAPFSDWDWSWLNGNPRNKDVAFDSKFFTPEIRADVTYNYDFNKPIDNSIGGSSEIFRANEIQLEQLGVGGDFHYDNVRARLMTQFGDVFRNHAAQ